MQIPDELVPKLLKQRQTNNFLPLTFKLPAPYHEWQNTLMNNPCPLMVFACGTKVGKTLAGSVRLAKFSFELPSDRHGLYRIIAPTYQQSNITFKYLDRLLPEKIPYSANIDTQKAQDAWSRFTPSRSQSNRTMRWQHNGAVIQCVHGENPEVTIEGEGTAGNVIDEAAKCKPEVIASVMSTTSQTGGWICAYSTAVGKNHFYKLWCQARDRMEWCLRHNITPDMMALQLPTIVSPFVKPSVIEVAKRTLPPRLYRQLYEASFEDDGNVFIGVRQCIRDMPEINLTDRIQIWTVENTKERNVILACDWAKQHDYTVVTAWDYVRKEVVGFFRTTGVNYKDILQHLYHFGHKFASVASLRHDETGIGNVIDELLGQLGWPVEGVTLTNQSKAELVNKFIVAIQHGLPILPNWPDMVRELESYELTTNKIGLMSFNAPAGQHDDIVVSLFLGWSAVAEMSGEFSVRFLDDLPKTKEIDWLYHSLNLDGDFDDD